jgi:hypothetical protein
MGLWESKPGASVAARTKGQGQGVRANCDDKHDVNRDTVGNRCW